MTIDTLKTLREIKGTWVGKSRLLVPPMNIDETTTTRIAIVPVNGGAFVRADYSWSFQKKPQLGSFLIGQSDDTVSVHWIDTWHMGKKVLELLGKAKSADALDVRGSYPAPEGPPWGWRLQVSRAQGKLRIVHHNVEPSGTEHLAIDATYERAKQRKARAKKKQRR